MVISLLSFLILVICVSPPFWLKVCWLCWSSQRINFWSHWLSVVFSIRFHWFPLLSLIPSYYCWLCLVCSSFSGFLRWQFQLMFFSILYSKSSQPLREAAGLQGFSCPGRASSPSGFRVGVGAASGESATDTHYSYLMFNSFSSITAPQYSRIP